MPGSAGHDDISVSGSLSEVTGTFVSACYKEDNNKILHFASPGISHHVSGLQERAALLKLITRDTELQITDTHP